MLPNSARQKSIYIYHLYMGGADADALECGALLAPRFQVRLQHLGMRFVDTAAHADIVLVTGLLLVRNAGSVLEELAAMPSPAVLVAVGDAAINGGVWSGSAMPGLAPYPLDHYAGVGLSVPGNPPTPQAILAALSDAAYLITQPAEQLEAWRDDTDG